jgi:hypothetical protein
VIRAQVTVRDYSPDGELLREVITEVQECDDTPPAELPTPAPTWADWWNPAAWLPG